LHNIPKKFRKDVQVYNPISNLQDFICKLGIYAVFQPISAQNEAFGAYPAPFSGSAVEGEGSIGVLARHAPPLIFGLATAQSGPARFCAVIPIVHPQRRLSPFPLCPSEVIFSLPQCFWALPKPSSLPISF
jgi:hypothetical protein